MKHKLSLMILLGVLMISLVSASDYIGHKQNTDLAFSITSNNATGCNVTSMDTSTGTSNLNSKMIKNSQTFTITIKSGNFTALGDTCFNIECFDVSKNIETGSVCRSVTPSGFTGTTGFYVIFLIIIVGIFVLGFMTKNNFIMMFGSIAVLFFGFFIIKFGIDIVKDTQTTWAIGLITWAIGLVCIYISLEEQLKPWE